MDVLLDTNVAVWWADDPSLLHAEAVAAIADPANTVWFTSASAWELAIKVRGGKLSIDVAKLVDQLTRNGIRLLGIGIDDAIAAGSLEWAHRQAAMGPFVFPPNAGLGYAVRRPPLNER